jgi:hypothetical protein
MLVEHLRRTVANTGGTLREVPTRSTRLSQYCHGCKRYIKKPLSERWHHCVCGVGPVQRDLYSAFLAAYLHAPDYMVFFRKPWSFMPGMNKNEQGHPFDSAFVAAKRRVL